MAVTAKFTHPLQVVDTAAKRQKISDAAERFGVSQAHIIRLCTDRVLDEVIADLEREHQ